MADYVNRIARGAKPADRPIERPTVFETVINLKTAKSLGLQFSQAMLLRANESHVRFWHLADIRSCTAHACFREESGHAVLQHRCLLFDPRRTCNLGIGREGESYT